MWEELLRVWDRGWRFPSTTCSAPLLGKVCLRVLAWDQPLVAQENVTPTRPMPVDVNHPCLPHILAGIQYGVVNWNECCERRRTGVADGAELGFERVTVPPLPLLVTYDVHVPEPPAE